MRLRKFALGLVLALFAGIGLGAIANAVQAAQTMVLCPQSSGAMAPLVVNSWVQYDIAGETVTYKFRAAIVAPGVGLLGQDESALAEVTAAELIEKHEAAVTALSAPLECVTPP